MPVAARHRSAARPFGLSASPLADVQSFKKMPGRGTRHERCVDLEFALCPACFAFSRRVAHGRALKTLGPRKQFGGKKKLCKKVYEVEPICKAQKKTPPF